MELTVKQIHFRHNSFPMTGFELWTSGVGSDRCTNSEPQPMPQWGFSYPFQDQHETMPNQIGSNDDDDNDDNNDDNDNDDDDIDDDDNDNDDDADDDDALVLLLQASKWVASVAASQNKGF